ncbi:MAG: hypothetical protein FRX49_06809 [Trebouxia sp. A1-2]|nr:MAG: hypothetical protein FRX49_06809 [Trebouxia sp. A1-2]
MLTPFGSLPNPADLRMLTLRWNGEFGGQDAVKARCLMTVRYRAQFPEAQMDGYKAHGFTESRAGLSTGRHSKNNVAGVDDMVSAQLELKLCLLFATQNTLLNNALFTRLRSAPVKIMCMQAQPLCKDSRYYGIYNVVSGYSCAETPMSNLVAVDANLATRADLKLHLQGSLIQDGEGSLAMLPQHYPA